MRLIPKHKLKSGLPPNLSSTQPKQQKGQPFIGQERTLFIHSFLSLFIHFFFKGLVVGKQCYRHLLIQGPCSRDSSMTPSQLAQGIRHSIPIRLHPELLKLESNTLAPTTRQILNLPTHVTSIEVGGSQPVGLGHQAFNSPQTLLGSQNQNNPTSLFNKYAQFFFFFTLYFLGTLASFLGVSTLLRIA